MSSRMRSSSITTPTRNSAATTACTRRGTSARGDGRDANALSSRMDFFSLRLVETLRAKQHPACPHELCYAGWRGAFRRRRHVGRVGQAPAWQAVALSFSFGHIICLKWLWHPTLRCLRSCGLSTNQDSKTRNHQRSDPPPPPRHPRPPPDRCRFNPRHQPQQGSRSRGSASPPLHGHRSEAAREALCARHQRHPQRDPLRVVHKRDGGAYQVLTTL